MYKKLICLFLSLGILSSLVGCSSQKTGDLIKKDWEENNPGSTYGEFKDWTVTFAPKAEESVAEPEFVIDSHYGKSVETKEDYIAYAEYILLRNTQFYLVNTRMQSLEGKDSRGLSYTNASTVSIICKLPSKKDMLLDNKYEIDIRDILKNLFIVTLLSHDMSWQEPALEDIVYQKFDEGLTEFALLRSTLLGDVHRPKLIVKTSIGDNEYLHNVEPNTYNLDSFTSYGILKNKIGEYYLNGGLVNMQISPLGTSIIATFSFAGLSTPYDVTQEELNRYTMRGSFKGDPEGKVYVAKPTFELNGVRPTKLGMFFATFEIPMQGSTSALQDRVKDSFEITMYDEYDNEMLKFTKWGVALAK